MSTAAWRVLEAWEQQHPDSPYPLIAALLLLLLHGRPGELNRRLRGWLPLFEQVYPRVSGEEDLGAVVCYLREIGTT